MWIIQQKKCTFASVMTNRELVTDNSPCVELKELEELKEVREVKAICFMAKYQAKRLLAITSSDQRER